MDELFKRLLDLLPVPLLVTVIAVGAVAWVVKQLKPGSEYGDVLRDKTFQSATMFILALSICGIGLRLAWTRLRTADFRPGENGICVARFQDDNGQILQLYTVEQLRAVISQDPLLANVRVEPYPVEVTSPAEARSLGNRHHAIATIWGRGISGFGANIASFEVTPSTSGHEIRKLCPKFPDIDDFTQGMVAFVRASVSVISQSPHNQKPSAEQQEIQSLQAANIRLSERLKESESRENKSASVAASSSGSQKRHFGIFIGINDYAGIGLSQRFAARDAQDMASAFRNASSSHSNINMLLDSQATRNNVLLMLAQVAQEVKPDDQVWFYFSGVGYRYESTGSSYLALADTTKESFTTNSLSSNELLDWIKSLKSKQVLVLLDACHSGLEAHRGMLRTRDDDAPGRVFIAAAGPDGLAFEEASLGHGTFTYYLLEGLSGKADLGGNGYLTPFKLFSYVRQKIDGNTATSQAAVFEVIDGSGDFTIADLRSVKSNKAPGQLDKENIFR